MTRKYEAMLDQYVSDYQSAGFVVVRGFYSSEEIDELNSELERFIREVGPRAEPGQFFYHDESRPETLKQINSMANDAYFADYPMMARWTHLAETLIGEEAKPKAPQWFNKPPGTDHPTPPHQDNYYFNLVPPNVCTMWLALDEVDEENGCLRYISGSHKQSVRPHMKTSVLGFSQGIEDYSDADRAAEVVVQMQPGDLAVHHGDTIHRADANHSAHRDRRSFALVYEGVSCERDTEKHARYQELMKTQHEEIGYKG